MLPVTAKHSSTTHSSKKWNVPRNTSLTKPLKVVAPFSPAGDQPSAISKLVGGLNAQEQNQVLLGVTGSGKTLTMAHVIAETGRPALVLAHNKTLAAQLYGEFRAFFPHNAVEYFVSYYDYYQPEAYVARTDTYIEKDSSVNEQIDRMRHSATRAMLEREDVIVVASVSCIYGIGSPEAYMTMAIDNEIGDKIDRSTFIKQLVELQYRRNDMAFERGCFRVRGDRIDIFPAHYEDQAWRISLFGDEIEAIHEFDPLTGQRASQLKRIRIFPNSHYVTPGPTIRQAIIGIREELQIRLTELESENRLVEAQRLEQRTMFDLEQLETHGSCSGIENYARYLAGYAPGEPPPTLFDYLPENALLFVDESHVTIPQIRAMYRGDFSRKSTLSHYGFRLPSCLDNRPLKFEEWDTRRPQTVLVSATPADWELQQTDGEVAEQIARPTGLLDPVIEIRSARHQVDDLLAECQNVITRGSRILVTVLTKRMAEQLADYLHEKSIKVRYLHSDIDTLERISIIQDLRNGVFDVLVGINLLREGLDIPECSLVAILDADKEGFLRSRTSLVQTIGRAARNIDARVILYADTVTASMQAAIDETDRRRERQLEFNRVNNIVPTSVAKSVTDVLSHLERAAKTESAADPRSKTSDHNASRKVTAANRERNADAGKADRFSHLPPAKKIKELRKLMYAAASDLDFERAAELRDLALAIEKSELELGHVTG